MPVRDPCTQAFMMLIRIDMPGGMHSEMRVPATSYVGVSACFEQAVLTQPTLRKFEQGFGRLQDPRRPRCGRRLWPHARALRPPRLVPYRHTMWAATC